MSEVVVFREGGYRYIKAVLQYSSGVAAEPGFEIERVRLRRPLPLGEGLAAIEMHLRGIGRVARGFSGDDVGCSRLRIDEILDSVLVVEHGLERGATVSST